MHTCTHIHTYTYNPQKRAQAAAPDQGNSYLFTTPPQPDENDNPFGQFTLVAMTASKDAVRTQLTCLRVCIPPSLCVCVTACV